MTEARTMKSLPTMVDVARAAGVSQKTVSRVINGEPNVRSSVRERVLEHARLLGYRRNDLAAILTAPRRGRTIGVLIEDLADPFWASMVSGIEEAVRADGYSLLIASSSEDPVLERGQLDLFLSRRVDGVLVVPSSTDHEYLQDDIARGTPFVFVDRPAASINVDTVLVAHAEGSRAATEHLIAHGHSSIAYAGHDASIFTGAERKRGFDEAIASAGIVLPPQYVRTDVTDIESARVVTQELLALDSPPTAIFADNNRATIGVVIALMANADAQVALVGFDDFELAASLGVTVVKHDARELGRVAVERLLTRVNGSGDPVENIVLPTTILARGSGELLPRIH